MKREWIRVSRSMQKTADNPGLKNIVSLQMAEKIKIR